MFEMEIMNKRYVSLYDCNHQLLTSGIITGYKEARSYMIIDRTLIFPIQQVAKIVVHQEEEIPSARLSAHRRL